MTGRQTRNSFLSATRLSLRRSSAPAKIRALNFRPQSTSQWQRCLPGSSPCSSLAFRGGHMAVVYGVIFAFIAAFFAVPALFPGQAPEGRVGRKRCSLFDLGHRGIATATGRASARDATILVLLLPFLILCFGIAVATIASLTCFARSLLLTIGDENGRTAYTRGITGGRAVAG